MSPRGGGGGSSSGGAGRAGGGSVSSSSGSKGGGLSGSGGTKGTSSYSGGSKGGKGSTRPSYSGSTNGGSGSNHPSYFGGTNGGNGRKRPWGGYARNCWDYYSDFGYACPYTSAAIPSKNNNPLSFLSRRAHVQPRGQYQNVLEDAKEPFTAFEEDLLSDLQSAGSQNSMTAAQVSPQYDSWSICQGPHGNKCTKFVCGVASDPVPFFLGLVLLFLLAASFFARSKQRKHHERSEKEAEECADGIDNSQTEDTKVVHIEYADSSEAAEDEAVGAADVERAISGIGMEEPTDEACEEQHEIPE
ncbi:MAG: hypothetical protein LQ349_004838, partial [Xanthoria aureola]